MSLLERRGSIAVLRPDSPLRHDLVDRLDDQLRSAISVGVPSVVIDLSDTALIDGAGLDWILTLDEECCRRGGCVRLCNVGELCGDLLRITGIGASIQKYDDLESALRSFA